MDEFIFFITGEVEHPLTIDPSVWIFDERKVDLNTFFIEKKEIEDPEIAYRKAISAQWDKEIIEGSEAPNPNANGNKITYNKKELLNLSYGMPLEPFLLHTNPKENANKVKIITKSGEEFTYDFEVARKLIAGFSKEGKPLKEDGPIHLYHGDGTNLDSPIKEVSEIKLVSTGNNS
ncbi:hypothetical protein AJ85_09145 [Alkalihalobacillus alcalophilus ATCC 27647 = CGMCC 1.3604]|uniref:Peptidyl-prolyl cis-trans isomerase n=2 Tax=Alkalihalobacillus alcalophilus TaxID=1445 RepID=A0A4S4JZJ1_ALKAL|nr:hypothetical protein [Alkalihalobacillus alcalophilus]MED1564249.1 peptidyl-prolyl cis-trans isomerase [Alkalihalobacillus alcalophilus]THG90726.1 hypothetical protein AJ85_09145 [Alkalihalobacillus alcalophilus ATCC 27647 = CGMCC 1.3604]